MMKITKIPVPIYYGTLRIVICDDFKEASRILNVYHGNVDPDTCGAFVDVYSNGIGLEYFSVFFKPNVDHNLIAHEVVHLVNGIYKARGIRLSRSNDENQAYLTGWITEQIYKTVNKYGNS